jgi:hypothetical protein
VGLVRAWSPALKPHLLLAIQYTPANGVFHEFT